MHLFFFLLIKICVVTCMERRNKLHFDKDYFVMKKESRI